MPDYEVEVDFEYETDVEIDFSNYTEEEIKDIINSIKKGEIITFTDVYIQVEAETTVWIPPDENDW